MIKIILIKQLSLNKASEKLKNKFEVAQFFVIKLSVFV